MKIIRYHHENGLQLMLFHNKKGRLIEPLSSLS